MGYRISKKTKKRFTIDNPIVVGVKDNGIPRLSGDFRRSVAYDNPRITKVKKSSNGKLGNIKPGIGISGDRLSSIPDLRVGREWYIRITSTGIVHLYFIPRAIHTDTRIGAHIFTLGKITGDRLIRRTDLSLKLWSDLAYRMFGDSTAIDRVLSAMESARVKHLNGRQRVRDNAKPGDRPKAKILEIPTKKPESPILKKRP